MSIAFKASLITPEAIVLETHISAAQVPVFDGLVGILHQRAPLLAKLATGVLRLDTVDTTGAAGPSQRYFVSGGYAQMKDDELTILTTEAIPAEKISTQILADEQAKLDAVRGTDLKAMEQRQALQARVQAIHHLLNR